MWQPARPPIKTSEKLSAQVSAKQKEEDELWDIKDITANEKENILVTDANSYIINDI